MKRMLRISRSCGSLRAPAGASGLAVAVSAAAAALAVACGGEGGTPATDAVPTAWVEVLGSDTMAVETIRRGEGRIEGVVVARSPVTRRIAYAMDLDPSGAVRRFETEHTTPPENPDGPGRWHATIEVDGHTATVVREAEGRVDTATVEFEGILVPSTGRMPPAAGLVEFAVRRATAGGSEVPTEPVAIGVLSPWGGTPQALANAITPRGAGEYTLDFFGSPMVISTTADGRVAAISGAETTMKIEVEPAGISDIDALAADFAARDAAGQGMGTPSPQASATLNAGGPVIEVVYSRPAKRGRRIWGGLVPWGEVWRTGANAATQFTTDTDLMVGDLEVPAGTYTLWTTFTEDSAELIVNRQTRIWGTAYDASHDLGRTAMERSTLQEPAERFTISIEATDDGGILHMDWDRTRFSVPLKAR